MPLCRWCRHVRYSHSGFMWLRKSPQSDGQTCRYRCTALSHAAKVTLTVIVVGGDPHVHWGLLHGTTATTTRPARSDQADEWPLPSLHMSGENEINHGTPQVGHDGFPCGLRRSSAATRLLRLWVRISPGAWMSVCCECCVLSGRGLCDELITHQEESYRLWCVVMYDLETSWMRRPWATGGGLSHQKQTKKHRIIWCNIV